VRGKEGMSLDFAALDDTDEVCRLHDHLYCKCGSIYSR